MPMRERITQCRDGISKAAQPTRVKLMLFKFREVRFQRGEFAWSITCLNSKKRAPKRP